MKKILTIVFFLTCFYCFSQSKAGSNNSKVINNKATKETKKYSSAYTNAVFDTLKHNVCLDKQFSIVFYIVLDSTKITDPGYPGVGAATVTNLDTLMREINRAFKPICISFVNCSTVYIPNYNYGKRWKKSITEPYVTASYYTDKTINFYFVDSVSAGFGNAELEGYTYEPTITNLATPKKDIIVLDKYKILQGNCAVSKHLLGHFFGLPHTFGEINPTPAASPPPPAGVISQEFANGSNCYVHGDGFCDTEADSGDPSSYTTDGMGVFYLHPFDNFMSYYGQRSRFSQEQYNFMAYTIVTKRLYLH